ncbi:MAG TPA: hypothetical protein EYM80_10990 [Deltaproteobacteria bacterium]|nr:hypothetical protein [Deltaproteobacteria bacterium]
MWEAVAMLAIGFICTPAGSFANDYTWPPRENAPVLTLLGPVYETGLELESELTVILADSLKKLANSPECCLPESYIDALGGTQYLRFVTGYSHDAEWGSIKSIADQIDGTPDPERVAGILENNQYRKPGLELAVRLRYKTRDLSKATLEGYRLILQPNGQAFAEWYEEEIDTSIAPSEQIMKALVRLLLKPLWQMSEFTVIQRSSSEYLPVQTDAEADWTLLQQCVFSGACPGWSTAENDVFFKEDTFRLFTRSRSYAKLLCESIGLKLISKDVVNLASQMRGYGFNDVMHDIEIHGVWVHEEKTTPVTIDLNIGVDKTTTHNRASALERYNKRVEEYEKNVGKINSSTQLRNREVLRKQASLIWCQMNKDITPRTAIDIYAPDKVGIRFGVALAYEQGEAELKGKSDKGIKFAYALNGFRLILSTFPAKRYFSFEQVSGHGEILKPGTPLYLFGGTKLYTVSGVSSTITRFLYTPRRDPDWFYAVGWESAIHTLQGTPANISARRSSPVLEGGYNFARWLPWWFQENSLFLEAKAGISAASGNRIGFTLGYQSREAFRPFSALNNAITDLKNRL